MSFEKNLKILMATRDFNQKELAIKLGVTQGTVSSWLRGEKNPTHNNLKKISHIFDVNLSNLIDSSLMELELSEEDIKYLSNKNNNLELNRCKEEVKRLKNQIEVLKEVIFQLKTK